MHALWIVFTLLLANKVIWLHVYLKLNVYTLYLNYFHFNICERNNLVKCSLNKYLYANIIWIICIALIYFIIYLLVCILSIFIIPKLFCCISILSRKFWDTLYIIYFFAYVLKKIPFCSRVTYGLWQITRSGSFYPYLL